MAETIRRNARPVRRQGAGQSAGRGEGKGGRAAPRSRRRGSIADALMRVLPFTEQQLHRLFLALILAALGGLAWLVASLAGLPQLAGAMLAQRIGAAGFEVRHVEVRGIERMNELAVYERVLGVRDRAMPLVDLAALRASLLELPWVRDARISRQLPDTIVVDIVEREPHAVLRTGAGLALIDRTGRVLERVSPQSARGRLVVAGEGVQRQVAALDALLASAPALQAQVAEAEWIGQRRWNLTFVTGQVLQLPQGTERSRTALLSFAQLDESNRLIGGQVAAFDMRNPDRIYLRVPGRAAAAAAARLAAEEG